MAKHLFIRIVPIILLFVLAGCDQLLFGSSILHPAETMPDQNGTIAQATLIPTHSVTTLDYLVERLRSTGAEVTLGESLSQPFFDVVGQLIHVNGEDIQVFEFSDETVAENAAAQISPDGGSTGTTMMAWIATPHFFKMGQIIVLYVGDSEDVLNLLQELLGPQFAGK